VKKIEIFSLMDVDLQSGRLGPKRLDKIAGLSDDDCPLLERYRNSFHWVFSWKGDIDNALNGTRRLGLTSIAKQHGFVDASFLIAEEFGVGVLCLQHTTDSVQNLDQALERKDSTNSECWDNAPAILQKLGFNTCEFDRQYPIVGIELSVPSIKDFLNSEENKLKIARLFTGNYEFESNADLLKHIENEDLSHRSYERLHLRWTDALAVYDEGVGDDFETAFMRCVLLYETCVLMRRILLTGIDKMDSLSSSMTFLPRPFAFNQITESIAQVRAELINAPPVQSEEANRLLSGAYHRFGIRPLAEASIERAKLLESRFQWSKSQLLAGLAVLTYLLEKLHFFDWLTGHSHK
jgi:hypothetical protein